MSLAGDLRFNPLDFTVQTSRPLQPYRLFDIRLRNGQQEVSVID